MQRVDRARIRAFVRAAARLLPGLREVGHQDSRSVESCIARAHPALASNDAARRFWAPSESSHSGLAQAQPRICGDVRIQDVISSSQHVPPSSWRLPAPGTACGQTLGSGGPLWRLRQLLAGIPCQPDGRKGLTAEAGARRAAKQSAQLDDLVLPSRHFTGG